MSDSVSNFERENLDNFIFSPKPQSKLLDGSDTDESCNLNTSNESEFQLACKNRKNKKQKKRKKDSPIGVNQFKKKNKSNTP